MALTTDPNSVVTDKASRCLEYSGYIQD